jgi:hypothetical protein
MGIAMLTIGDRHVISHGGGINGFLSHAEYYPAQDLTVVVLFNTAGPVSPQSVAREIANAVLGKPAEKWARYEGDLSVFAGSYSGRGRGAPTTIRIESRAGELHFLRGNGPSATDEKLHYISDGVFGFKDTLLRFRREGGKTTSVRLDTVGGNVVLAKVP